MKQLLFILFTLITILGYSQEKNFVFPEEEFQSKFINVKSGKYVGTVNGLLIVENQTGNQILIDCQGAKGELNIIPDEYEMYDVSTKKYSGYSTSGQTKINYNTYSSANVFEIELKGSIYNIGVFDGASDMVINGLTYQYVSESGMEYLILKFERPITLSNRLWLIDKFGTSENDLKKVNNETENITVLPNSVIVFAISTE